jgi:hypothetical protein
MIVVSIILAVPIGAQSLELDRARIPYFGDLPFEYVGTTGVSYASNRILSLGDEVVLIAKEGDGLRKDTPYLVIKEPKRFHDDFYTPVAVVRPLFQDGAANYVGEVIEAFGLFDTRNTYGLYDFRGTVRRMPIDAKASKKLVHGNVKLVFGHYQQASVGQFVGVSVDGEPESSLETGSKIYFYTPSSFWKKIVGKTKPHKVVAEGVVVFVSAKGASVLLIQGEELVTPGTPFVSILH